MLNKYAFLGHPYAIASCIALLCFGGCDRVNSGRGTNPSTQQSAPAGEFARPLASVQFSPELNSFAEVLFRQAEASPTLPRYTHLLLLRGKATTVAGQNVVSVLTSDDLMFRSFGRRALRRTANGVAYQWGAGGGETHRDQILCAFSQCGVSLDCPVTVTGVRYTVEDLLKDSIANFHLQQEELAWTAQAYSVYLCGKNDWQNKFGVSYRFDDVARKLLEASLADASCGGMHIVTALASIYRAHQQNAFLSEAVAASTQDFLNKCAAAAVECQSPDGSWDSSWTTLVDGGKHPSNEPVFRDTGDRTSLVVTGHLLEWLCKVDQEAVHVPEDVKMKAASYLLHALRAMRSEAVADQFCPVTHAILALHMHNAS